MLFLWDSGIRWPSISNFPTIPGSVAQGFTLTRCSALRSHSCWRNSEKGSTIIGGSNWESFEKRGQISVHPQRERKEHLRQGTIPPVAPENRSVYWNDTEETDSPWNTPLFHEVVHVMGRRPVCFHIYYNLPTALEAKWRWFCCFRLLSCSGAPGAAVLCGPSSMGVAVKRMSMFAPKAQDR